MAGATAYDPVQLSTRWETLTKWIVDFYPFIQPPLTFLAGFAVNPIRRYVQRRLNSVRPLLPFASAKSVNVSYGLMDPNSLERSYAAEEGNVATVFKVLEALGHILGRVPLGLVSHVSVTDNPKLLQSLLCIGGPKWNSITARLIGDLGSPARFSKSEACLVLRDSSTEEVVSYPTERGPGLARKCHGIILSGIVEKIGHDRWSVVVCAGNTTLSAFGMAVHLKRLGTSRSLVRDLRRHGVVPHKRWGLVVEVTNRLNREMPGLESIPLPEELVDTRVVRYLTEADFCEPYAYEYAES